jgi:hypothetical protein
MLVGESSLILIDSHSAILSEKLAWSSKRTVNGRQVMWFNIVEENLLTDGDEVVGLMRQLLPSSKIPSTHSC